MKTTAIDNEGREEYDKTALKDLKSRVTLEKKWTALKKQGEKALLLDSIEPYKRICGFLVKHNVYLVPVGELEGFVNVSGHGPKWVANVFEQYPNLDNTVYDEAKQFIQERNV